MSRLVEITSLCRTFHCLPGPGGLFQQDPYLMDGMGFVLEAMNEREEHEANKKK